jgi:ABC-type branched-subunit amino acid transport system substrate-binding protein
MRAWRGRIAVVCVALVSATALATSGNAPVKVTNIGQTSGVTSKRILVGALASQTGPVSADFAPVITGVQIYFDMVNAAGGIDGRKLDLGYKLDDESDPSADTSQARALVEQYHVFAVVGVATPTFSGASYLASQSVPTFGLNVNPNSEWGASPAMFGNTGSYTDFTGPQLQTAFLAEKHHVHAAAVLAYNIAASRQGCQGVLEAFKRYHVHLAVKDLSIPYPAADLHADVTRMKSAGVNMVASCLDLGGNLTLAETLQQEGMSKIVQLWFDGYDESALARASASMQGVYLYLQHVPFEVATLYPGRYRGMDMFIAALKRYAKGMPPSEAALAGWTSAALFAKGLRMIGRNVTRTRLVAAINSLSAFTADGILAPVDWRVAHGPNTDPYNCTAFVKVIGKHFVPVYGTPPSVFSCFPPNPAGPPVKPVAPLPRGVPPL